MRTDLLRFRGARRYVNVQSEGPPRFPGDPQIEDDTLDDLPELGDIDSEPDQERPALHDDLDMQPESPLVAPLPFNNSSTSASEPERAPTPASGTSGVTPGSASRQETFTNAYGPQGQVRSTPPVLPYPALPNGLIPSSGRVV